MLSTHQVLSVWVFCLHVCAPGINLVPQRLEGGIRSPGTGATGLCELPCGFSGLFVLFLVREEVYNIFSVSLSCILWPQPDPPASTQTLGSHVYVTPVVEAGVISFLIKKCSTC